MWTRMKIRISYSCKYGGKVSGSIQGAKYLAYVTDC